MKNARLRKCPRCGSAACNCDERLLANALAQIATGVINLDIVARSCWLTSMRRWGRTAFIELKRDGEILGPGQGLALADVSGTLTTLSGRTFEQRSFLVRRDGPQFTLVTYKADWRAPEVLALETSIGRVARIIATWMERGTLAKAAA